jgi:BON domain-containing protein
MAMTQLSWITPAILILTLLLATGWGAKERATASPSTTFLIYNLELERSIRAKLETDKRLKGAIDVSVEAAKNEVTLSGAVASAASRDRAVELVQSAHAGLVINNRIAVKPAA